MYVYVNSEPGLWTVGFYDPSGHWHADSDHETRESAAYRVHFLNGGKDDELDDEPIRPITRYPRYTPKGE